MTAPDLANSNGNGGRVYTDPLPPCDLYQQLGYQHTPDVEYPSVTAVLSAGVPKQAIAPWAAKAVAELAYEYLTDPDGHDRLLGEGRRLYREEQQRKGRANIDPSDDQAAAYALKWLKTAPDRQRDKAAARGNDIHDIVEKLAAGQIVLSLNDDLEPWVRSARQFVADFRPKVIWSETTVFNRHFGYAGTLDLIADFPGYGRMAADYKSGKSVYGDVGLQLAAYRYSEYGVRDGARHLLPDGIEGGLVIHLTADGYQVRPVECGPTQLDGFLNALGVADHCKNANRLIGKPLPPPDHTNTDHTTVKAGLERRILTIVDGYPNAAQQLADLWPADLPTIRKPAHTADQLAEIARLVDRVEAAHEIPFGETTPTMLVGANTTTGTNKDN